MIRSSNLNMLLYAKLGKYNLSSSAIILVGRYFLQVENKLPPSVSG